MKKRLMHNFGLKIISFLCAILLWGVIVNVNDPSDKTTINNIPVNLTNTKILTDSGYIYEIVDNTDSVVIEVKGPRSIIEGLKSSDFKASAEITNEYADTAKIVVECVNPNINDSNITITLKNEDVKLDVQNLANKTFDVEADFTGSPSKGYYADASLISISPTSLRISGPENLVERIATVKVKYDVTGEKDTITASVVPVLYDENGKVIDSSKLTFSKNVVTYKMDLLKLKTVDVNFATFGDVMTGYKLTSISSTLSQVTIAGTTSELAKISSIDIPANLIDVTDLNKTKEYVIPVSQYVPSTVRYVTEDTKATVTVDIAKLKEKTLILANNRITVKNVGAGLKLEYVDNTTNKVVLSGIQSEIADVTIDDLTAEIDLTGLKQGEHTVVVKVSTKSDVDVVGNYKVNVRLVETASQENEYED